MSIVAFKNIFNDDVVRHIDAFYQRYEPTWLVIEKFRMELSKGKAPEFLFNTEHNVFAYWLDDEELDEEDEEYLDLTFKYILKFETNTVYFAEVPYTYRLEDGEHLFNKSNMRFADVLRALMESFIR